MKRLVVAVVVLNVVVLGLLAAVTMTGGGDESPDASVDGDGALEATTAAEGAGGAEVPGSPGDSEVGVGVDVTDDVDVDDGVDDADLATDVVDPVVSADDLPTPSSEAPPYPDPFEPSANDVQPDAKQLGALVAYVITNYEVESSLTDVLATLPADPDRAEALAWEVQTVYQPEMWSRGTVEYAQLGGHLNGRISIMVIVRQDLGIEGSEQPVRTERRTVDVRLVRAESGVWEFEEIASAGGQPVARPDDLSPVAAAVVDDPRIDLPDSAIWDIYSGHTDDPLLQLMLDLAEETPYSVAVLHTGHPENVFGTPRLSNHTVGRAVDIYAFDSQLVIDSHDVSSPLYAVSEWVVSRRDIKEFGSPWRFEDAVAHTFTNQVHHDHIHIGVWEVIPPLPDDVDE